MQSVEHVHFRMINLSTSIAIVGSLSTSTREDNSAYQYRVNSEHMPWNITLQAVWSKPLARQPVNTNADFVFDTVVNAMLSAHHSRLRCSVCTKEH
eukprot:717340-Amphidinium_carterae.1